jgi:hypothetical protein
MADPKSDGIFNPKSNITKQPDGSWQISGRPNIGKYDYEVRMNVNTSQGAEEWKNVEITGYARVVSAEPPYNSLVWYARGGRHDSSIPCEGTSLKGGIKVNGVVSWAKEIWHTGGYTDKRAEAQVTNSLIGRWIGWKIVIYNIDNNNAVKMESYLDDKANNKWIKVTDLIDNGGWYSNSPDSVFYSANCGKPKDYVITNGGPIITFRSDNIVWDFKNLSVREIQSPPQTDSSWYLVYNIINHALNKMMDYILQYYSHFGIEVHRQSFSYKVSFFHYYIYCSILAISCGNTSIQFWI